MVGKIRTKYCIVCGSAFETNTDRTQYCKPCGEKRRKEAIIQWKLAHPDRVKFLKARFDDKLRAKKKAEREALALAKEQENKALVEVITPKVEPVKSKVEAMPKPKPTPKPKKPVEPKPKKPAPKPNLRLKTYDTYAPYRNLAEKGLATETIIIGGQEQTLFVCPRTQCKGMRLPCGDRHECWYPTACDLVPEGKDRLGYGEHRRVSADLYVPTEPPRRVRTIDEWG